jgi:hypothetical protein
MPKIKFCPIKLIFLLKVCKTAQLDRAKQLHQTLMTLKSQFM